MSSVRYDQNIVARTKIALTFALNAEAGRTCEEYDPFVVSLLTMGVFCRRRLTR